MDYLLSLNPFVIVLLVATFNWLMTFLGASLVYFVKEASQKIVCFALGSSAGIMVGASFFSLILPALQYLENSSKLELLIIPIGFICGVGLLMIIDKLLPHEHLMSHDQEGINPSNYSKNKLLLLAMTLHNIPEGLAVGVAFAGCQDGNYLPALMELEFKIFQKEQQFLYHYIRVVKVNLLLYYMVSFQQLLKYRQL